VTLADRACAESSPAGAAMIAPACFSLDPMAPVIDRARASLSVELCDGPPRRVAVKLDVTGRASINTSPCFSAGKRGGFKLGHYTIVESCCQMLKQNRGALR